MTANKKEEEVVRKPSIHSVKEQKQNRLVIIGFIITIILIVGMIAYAFLFKTIAPLAKVCGDRIDKEYFDSRVRLQRNAMINTYEYYYVQYQIFSEQPEYASQFLSQLQQIQFMLDDKEYIGQEVLNMLVDEQVLLHEADKRGLQVSQEELDLFIQDSMGYFPQGTPTALPTATVFSTPTVSAKQKALLGSTPTPANTPTLAPTSTEESSQAEQEPTETSLPASEPTIAPTIAPAFGTPEPTPTVYTKELFDEAYTTTISGLNEIGVSEEHFRVYLHNYLLINKLRDEIYQEVPHEQEQVWARHILVTTEEEALNVIKRLDDGEDWNTLTAELSQDSSNKDNGGDLGWFSHGSMVAPFEEAAFSMQAGEISAAPVQTDFGWHIIQVIGRETRTLTSQEFANAQDIYFQDWVEKLKAECNIKTSEVWKDLVPVEPTLPAEMSVN